ncbi:hypothetical protein [Paenibacillus senegalensis]|uniref:hypothetical protein n=1 Tax=Paenibacillus senegalensis TaxID=1465766 RepID=UPI00028968C7|nr:hypothetical protein [Paenibacillus senegalensis]
MIPFSHTWPYESIGDDLYVQDCPFCEASHVLLPLKKKHLSHVNTGEKKLLVFPCCFNKVSIIEADGDYLLADRPLRKFT